MGQVVPHLAPLHPHSFAINSVPLLSLPLIRWGRWSLFYSAPLQLPRHSYSTRPQLRFNSPVTHIQLTLSFASTHPPLTHSITRSIADSMSITVVSPTLPYYFSTS